MRKKLKNSELNRIDINEYQRASKMPIIVVLDNIRSLNNIGSMFRTSDCVRIEAIYLCGITACPPHKDIHKTALGATDSVPWEYFTTSMEAIEKLKSQGYKVASVEQVSDSIMLNEYQPEENDKIALVFGNEVKGVDKKVVEASDFCLEIPQFGTKHSFNVTISAGIVLWDICQKIGFNKIQ